MSSDYHFVAVAGCGVPVLLTSRQAFLSNGSPFMAVALPDLSGSAQVGLIVAVVFLSLLALAGVVFSLVYRRRSVAFLKKSSELDLELGKSCPVLR